MPRPISNPCSLSFFSSPPLFSFHGFRFEITGPAVHGVGFRDHIVRLADSSSCFGWVQNVISSTGVQSVAGEVRCNKFAGPALQQALEKGPHPPLAVVKGVQVRVYEDTKIKLHFSHFKKLDDKRITCFRDEPHCCEDICGPKAMEGGGGRRGYCDVQERRRAVRAPRKDNIKKGQKGCL